MKSIILLDDEQPYAELLSMLLGSYFSCPIHVFTQPAELLPRLKELNPGVVITDFHMPGMSGPEFIRAAAPAVAEAAFLLMSGRDLHTHQAALAGLPQLKGILAKPFPALTLVNEILAAWPDSNHEAIVRRRPAPEPSA